MLSLTCCNAECTRTRFWVYPPLALSLPQQGKPPPLAEHGVYLYHTGNHYKVVTSLAVRFLNLSLGLSVIDICTARLWPVWLFAQLVCCSSVAIVQLVCSSVAHCTARLFVCGSLHSSSVRLWLIAQLVCGSSVAHGTARLWLIAQFVCGLLHSSSLGYGVPIIS